MRVLVGSRLQCRPEEVWKEVQRSSLLLEVMHPLVKIVPADGSEFPEYWLEGQTVKCKAYLFGMIPLGIRSLFFERIDDTAREIQTREFDPIVRHWDHLIRVQSTPDGQTYYSDEILIVAGLATFLVACFARYFYRHRQRNWLKVVRRLNGE